MVKKANMSTRNTRGRWKTFPEDLVQFPMGGTGKPSPDSLYYDEWLEAREHPDRCGSLR